MKKIFLLLATIFSISFFIVTPKIFADSNTTTTPPTNVFIDKNNDNIPGLTCGNARNPNINACCKVSDSTQSFGSELTKKIPQFACLIDATVGIPGIPLVSNAIGSVLDNIPGGSVVQSIPVVGSLLGGDSGPKIRGLCISDLFKGVIKGYLDDSTAAKQINELRKTTPVKQCVFGEPNQSKDGSCLCVESVGADVLCNTYLDHSLPEYGYCKTCAEKGGTWTAVGCFYSSLPLFISDTVLPVGLGLAGATAFLCILYAAFVMQTSRGNPERIKKARAFLNSCLIGLGLIIFSMFILRIIGVDILKIPGLG